MKMHVLYLGGWISFKFLHKLRHSRIRPQVTYTISLFKTVQKLKLWTVFFLLVLSQIKSVLVEIISLKGVKINFKNSIARHSKVVSGQAGSNKIVIDKFGLIFQTVMSAHMIVVRVAIELSPDCV